MKTRWQPPMPDTEPKASCPLFDAAIESLESARSVNAELRSIIEQWRKQAEYWEAVADDKQAEVDNLQEHNDEQSDQIKQLEKEISTHA